MEVVELAPNAEVTVYPWKEEKDVLANTIKPSGQPPARPRAQNYLAETGP